LRCRPETAPDSASWRGTSNTVSQALALIADAALDGDDANVAQLSERLGVGERQLRRLFLQHLGVSPVAVAQTRRVLFAKQLIDETQLSMTQVALAAGFGSVRRFNEVFRDLFHRPPSTLRRHTASSSADDAGVTLCLRYRPPYDWDAVLAYLAARAIPGVEVVSDGVYHRTVAMDGSVGSVRVAHRPEQRGLRVTIRFPSVRSLPAIVTRVRRLFDIGADIETIDEHLSRDPSLAPLVAEHPGLRAPGAWDGFEMAVRAILAQQASVRVARQRAGQLVVRCGQSVPVGSVDEPGLSHVFPTAEALANAESVVTALAGAALADPDLFRPFGTIETAIARFRSIRDVGRWTAQYIAMRAFRETDAFPASDAVLLRAASVIKVARPTPSRLLQRAEPWRPWRAYAAQHLRAARV
jgi:AraC family transcriptional regulator of adaptative response / DNA-3-methyladenine glycosylase II